MTKKRQPNKQSPGKSASDSHHQLRIIGGEWKSRRLSFTAIEGLRPTQDRVRETLFNWLMYEVEGANCLDVFAGSGALGLEALSRGAKNVSFIEKSSVAANQIKQHLATLNCARGKVIESDALKILSASANEPMDIIFLDPPFNQQLLLPSCEQLIKQGYSAEESLIYVEAEPGFDITQLPKQWVLVKDKSQSSKHIRLYRHQ